MQTLVKTVTEITLNSYRWEYCDIGLPISDMKHMQITSIQIWYISDFPGGPVVKTVLLLQGVRVRSLVGEVPRAAR